MKIWVGMRSVAYVEEEIKLNLSVNSERVIGENLLREASQVLVK